MDAKLSQFDFLWQAENVSNLLFEQGIQNKILFRPREYTEIIAGTSQGKYEIFVETNQLKIAQSILKVSSGGSSNLKEADASEGARRLYSTVIFFSFAAVLSFPLLFNWVAWQSFKRLKNTSIPQSKIRTARLVFILGIVTASIEVLWFFASY